MFLSHTYMRNGQHRALPFAATYICVESPEITMRDVQLSPHTIDIRSADQRLLTAYGVPFLNLLCGLSVN